MLSPLLFYFLLQLVQFILFGNTLSLDLTIFQLFPFSLAEVKQTYLLNGVNNITN